MVTNLRFLRTILAALLLAISWPAFAGSIDTVLTFSKAMNKSIKAVVVTPDSYKSGTKRYPVVYLLHGYGGNFKNWVSISPELATYVDNYQVIVVCPDGNIGSWYFDSPIDPAWKYETYVGTELVQWADANYRTIADRRGRGITGLSMGGHGALYLAFRHQDTYGVAGSTSGGVDFRPFPKNWDIAKRLGPLEDAPATWNDYTVTNMIGLLKPGALSLIIDCGTDDFFFAVNNTFHDKLLAAKIPHDYIVRPGKHDGPYWRNSIGYQLLYMSRYFTSNKAQ